jgi:hypothetical protein
VEGGVRTGGGTAQTDPFQVESGGQVIVVGGVGATRGVVVVGRIAVLVVGGGGAVDGGGGGRVVVVVDGSVVDVVVDRRTRRVGLPADESHPARSTTTTNPVTIPARRTGGYYAGGPEAYRRPPSWSVASVHRFRV